MGWRQCKKFGSKYGKRMGDGLFGYAKEKIN
jgi:hypothetical protein